ncbi:hypothetical protein QVD17_05688 [Tagetes erecta]|uniref:Knottins-like domain-containing protein n=1 Tax=Tagetes erecta TaxID=13708 RepID=A0AAD8LIS5_TARER|nr:hypothetical protein QVD17_05688 [Tagetes erecta]
MAQTSFGFSSVLSLIFVLVISEMAIRVNGQLCERESQTYSGLVCHILKCNRKCISWEKAAHGACHIRNLWRRCYCYFDADCSKFPATPGAPGGSTGGGTGKGGTGGSSGGTGGNTGGGGTGGSTGGSSGGTGGSTGGSGEGNNPCKQYVNKMLGMEM